MSKLAIGLIALAVGLLGGALVGGSLIGGAAAGAGAGVGLSAGICSTIGAAEDLGYLTAEQADDVLNRAAANLSDNSDLAAADEIVGSSAACEEVMQSLRDQAS